MSPFIYGTSDLERRFYEHNEGFSRYTKHKRPWKLMYHESFDNKSDAIKRERFLKKQKNKDFYNRLING